MLTGKLLNTLGHKVEQLFLFPLTLRVFLRHPSPSVMVLLAKAWRLDYAEQHVNIEAAFLVLWLQALVHTLTDLHFPEQRHQNFVLHFAKLKLRFFQSQAQTSEFTILFFPFCVECVVETDDFGFGFSIILQHRLRIKAVLQGLNVPVYQFELLILLIQHLLEFCHFFTSLFKLKL